MKIAKMLLGGAFLFLAAAGSMKAQIVRVNGIGSSALFLSLGQAASGASTAGGVGATCIWSTSTSNVVVATDPTTSSLLTPSKESGNAWIAWTPASGSCTTVNAATQVYAYLQTDSVVGDRCLFNRCTIGGGTAGDPTSVSTSGIILGAAKEQATVPTAVWNKLLNLAVNAAGTDIRPEDAQFAINRALAGCGTAVSSSNTNYLGLGYKNGDAIRSAVSGSTFRVIRFDSTSQAYTVSAVGAAPVVVAVKGSGFSGSSNISSSDLAAYLAGTYSGSVAPAATVLIREPLSGTYNTMEYNIPNTTTRYLSQDVGLNQPTAQRNCNGSVPAGTPTAIDSSNSAYTMSIATTGGGLRRRTIGTGQELSTLFASASDALGYSFWSTANFAGATSGSKYLTVDGVDPLRDSYVDGTIPTTSNGLLSNVTLSHVANGSYGIWSNIRLVNLGSTPSTFVTNLVNAAQNFVPSNPLPDFVKAANLTAVHSHFNPPGLSVTPSNGSKAIGATTCSATEAGGDVGGFVYTASQEQTTCQAGTTTGTTGVRK